MRPLLTLAAVLTLLTGVACRSHQASSAVVIEARVLEIGAKPETVNSNVASYRVARYSVLRTCSGKVLHPEIAVGHLMLTGSELDQLSKGVVVYLALIKPEQPTASAGGHFNYLGEIIPKQASGC